jgi:sugar transferase (PEP-CTERM/EpsH1 system associated)
MTESIYGVPAMRQILRRWSAAVEFDAVVAFSSGMAPLALEVPAPRRILDLCDLDSEKWRDYACLSRWPLGGLYRSEADRLADREQEWARLFDRTVLITEAEAEPLRARVPEARLHVVSNGVDIPALIERPKPAHPSTVGFVGAMDYFPNVDAVCWFVAECWGRVRKAVPDAVFCIVGRSPTRRVRRLARVPGVAVVGGVDDIGAEVRGFDTAIAPMRIGRGLQNKVLEAMAYGKPVVLTGKAVTGISGVHGRDYVVADDPEAFAAAVIQLLRDAEQRDRLGQNGRRFVRAHHQWESELRRFERIVFDDATEERCSPGGGGISAGEVVPAGIEIRL